MKSESEINEVEIQLKGFSDVYLVHNVIVPGGHTGWHSHPGVSFVGVKSGTASEYSGDDPDTPNVYIAGQGFVEAPGHVHLIANEDDSTPPGVGRIPDCSGRRGQADRRTATVGTLGDALVVEESAAGEVLTTKQAPHRPGTTPALGWASATGSLLEVRPQGHVNIGLMTARGCSGS